MEAPDKVLKMKGFFTAVITVGTMLWGTTGWVILLFLACVFLDYLTGTLAALMKGEWSSSLARQGLWHKLGEIFALLVAILCDIALRVVLQSSEAEILNGLKLSGTAFTLLVSVWYIFTELGSIIENVAKMGAPVPKFLIKAITGLKHQTESEGGTEELPMILAEIADESNGQENHG